MSNKNNFDFYRIEGPKIFNCNHIIHIELQSDHINIYYSHILLDNLMVILSNNIFRQSYYVSTNNLVISLLYSIHHNFSFMEACKIHKVKTF